MTVDHFRNLGSDIAFAQQGPAGVGKGIMALGNLYGNATHYNHDELQRILGTVGSADRVGYFDDFLGAAVSTRWATDLSTGATIAINSQVGGAIRFSTDTDDDDHATLALGLNFKVGSGILWFGARVKAVSAITLRAIEVGISDALSETNGLAFSNHSVGGVVDVATDAVMFGYDTDASMTKWAANAVKAGTPQAADTGVAPSTSYQNLEIIVDVDGNADFYIDGTLVASLTAALTVDTLVTPWISLKSLSGAIKSIDVDFAYVMCERP